MHDGQQGQSVQGEGRWCSSLASCEMLSITEDLSLGLWSWRTICERAMTAMGDIDLLWETIVCFLCQHNRNGTHKITQKRFGKVTLPFMYHFMYPLWHFGKTCMTCLANKVFAIVLCCCKASILCQHPESHKQWQRQGITSLSTAKAPTSLGSPSPSWWELGACSFS